MEGIEAKSGWLLVRRQKALIDPELLLQILNQIQNETQGHEDKVDMRMQTETKLDVATAQLQKQRGDVNTAWKVSKRD